MPYYSKGFDFDVGTLGVNLETLDARVKHFIKTDLDVAATKAEAQMKQYAPWKNRTWDARNLLWAGAEQFGGTYRITLGHGVQYGIYLEKSNGAKYQIIMPTLVAVSRAFMQSLELMFEQLDNPAPVYAAVEPGVGMDRGTSQGAVERGQHVRGAAEKAMHKATEIASTAFSAGKRVFQSVTKATRRTPRTHNKKRRWL